MSTLTDLAKLDVLAFLLLGVTLGLIVGAVPALGGISGLSILMPFVFLMEPEHGLVLFMGMVASTNTSDTLPAILWGVPGSSSSQATIMDGHPMAQKGEAARALGAAYLSSMIGGLLGAIFLTLSLDLVRPVILFFGSPELLMMGILGLSLAGALSKGAALKGLIGVCLGMLAGIIGLNQLTGLPRFTFDTFYLYDGVDIVLIALGLFAIPEILAGTMRIGRPSEFTIEDIKAGRRQGMIDTIRSWFLVVRSSVIGIVVGFLPGIGGSATGWLAYAHALQTEKGARETFGKGDVRGLIGSDASNNAAEGGGLFPTLAFGIPGSAAMGLVLSVILGLGLPIGPRLLADHQGFVLQVIYILVIANVLCTAIMLFLIPQTAKIARLPMRGVAPFLFVMIVVAAFSSSSNTGDLILLGVATLIGWLMRLHGWPRPPLLLGFILAPIMERYLSNSVDRYGVDWLTRPIVLVLGACIVAIVVMSVFQEIRASKKSIDAAIEDLKSETSQPHDTSEEEMEA